MKSLFFKSEYPDDWTKYQIKNFFSTWYRKRHKKTKTLISITKGTNFILFQYGGGFSFTSAVCFILFSFILLKKYRSSTLTYHVPFGASFVVCVVRYICIWHMSFGGDETNRRIRAICVNSIGLRLFTNTNTMIVIHPSQTENYNELRDAFTWFKSLHLRRLVYFYSNQSHSENSFF